MAKRPTPYWHLFGNAYTEACPGGEQVVPTEEVHVGVPAEALAHERNTLTVECPHCHQLIGLIAEQYALTQRWIMRPHTRHFRPCPGTGAHPPYHYRDWRDERGVYFLDVDGADPYDVPLRETVERGTCPTCAEQFELTEAYDYNVPPHPAKPLANQAFFNHVRYFLALADYQRRVRFGGFT